jgi:hypothetical protein
MILGTIIMVFAAGILVFGIIVIFCVEDHKDSAMQWACLISGTIITLLGFFLFLIGQAVWLVEILKYVKNQL